jgi:putative hydrolase of the HAD superfamily
MRPPVVSFDLDGVVMRGPFASQLRPRIWAHLGRAPALAHLAAAEREHEIWRAVRGEHDRRQAQGDFVGAWDWRAIYDEVSRGFGGDPVPELEPLVRECCSIDDAIALLPGSERGLERLASAGVRIVAITNGYRVFQWPVLEGLGVANLFDAVITPDVAGFAKPDPRIFALVPGLVAHVGDLLVHDVLGANRARVRSVWLDAEVPDEFRVLSPLDRPRAPGFKNYLSSALESSRYRRFHPEATPNSCMPTAVVRDVDEAASVLLESISAWTPPSD